MNYDDVRDAEQLSMLDDGIDDFITRHKNSNGTGSGQRRTLFLFPGGLASKLKRATTAFVEGVSAPGSFAYETIWLTPECFIGGAVDLELTKDLPIRLANLAHHSPALHPNAMPPAMPSPSGQRPLPRSASRRTCSAFS